MQIGLFFGSFNPIHIGHLIIANHIVHNSTLDKIWLMVSPHNPLKETKSLLNEYDRLHLVKLAIEGNPRLEASDFEFKLPRPSYTIDTLTYLEEQFPQHSFSIIMGSDSFQNIHRWKNFEILLQRYNLLIYDRPGFEIQNKHGANITTVQAPLLDISATYIRKQITQHQSIKYLCPDAVAAYIEENRYYRDGKG